MPNEVKLLPCEPTPEMASAGMHIISALPAEAGWPELTRAACDVYRAMVRAAPRPTTVVTDEVVVSAAAAIVDIWMGGDTAWRARLDDSDFLESADWQTALALARAAIASMPTVVTGER